MDWPLRCRLSGREKPLLCASYSTNALIIIFVVHNVPVWIYVLMVTAKQLRPVNVLPFIVSRSKRFQTHY
jgi:hypothetical protein